MDTKNFLIKARQVPYLSISRMTAVAALAVQGFTESPEAYGRLNLIKSVLPSRVEELEMAIKLLREELKEEKAKYSKKNVSL